MKVTRRRAAALVAAMTLAASGLGALNADPAAADDPLQPGDFHVASGGCTLNFVFDGTETKAGNVYFGTAAHCVGYVGQNVRDAAGHVFGKVALIGDANFTIHDWAFIEVLPSDVGRVDPHMLGHPDYPTGVTTMSEALLGSPIQISGYGTGFGNQQVTRENRVAVLTMSDSRQHRVAGPLIFGDSGGPLVHIQSGTAMGIVSRLCKTGCTETGPTVGNMIAAAEAAGLPLALRTV